MMTRKEPQFSDEINATSSIAEPMGAVDLSRHTASSVLGNESRSSQTGSQWLLWLFVTVSLCVSFGMAFFGLEEAGRYKAALDKAERQAAELETTIDRLNKVQSQGIGELAQSDAQMRQMMTNVENKLLKDFSADIQTASKRSDVFSSSMSAFNSDLTSLGNEIKRLQTLQASIKKGLDLSEKQKMADRKRLDVVLKDSAANSSDIQTLLKMGEQLDERIVNSGGDLRRVEAISNQALDNKTALLATAILSEEIVALKSISQDYEREIQKFKEVDVQTTGFLEKLSERVASLPSSEARLVEFAKTLDRFGVERMQLTQRILDFEERWSLVNKLQRTILDLEQRQDNAKIKLDTSSLAFGELKEEVNQLRALDRSE